MKRIELTCCSFCNKPAREVEYIVQSNNETGTAICNECVKVSQEIIDEERDKKNKELNDAKEN